MRNTIFGLLTIAALLLSTTVNAQSKNERAIKNLVQNYFEALNAGDVTKATSAFTKSGVLLPQGAPTATGTEQIKGTFQYVFDNFSYDLKVTIDQVIVEGKHAIVSSTSMGSFVVKAKNETVESQYRETFILQEIDGAWKIVRYMYNQPN